MGENADLTLREVFSRLDGNSNIRNVFIEMVIKRECSEIYRQYVHVVGTVAEKFTSIIKTNVELTVHYMSIQTIAK
jgi:hypothetical protein